jgi:anti-sigma B factor antagonist
VHEEREHRRAQPSGIEIGAHSPAISTVTLRGEHDLHSWSEVTLALANASQRRGVVVDLTACTFLDSSMLTALLVAAKQLRTRGGALAVVIPREAEIRRIFEVMNVDAVLAIHETRAAAIADMSGDGAGGASGERAQAA